MKLLYIIPQFTESGPINGVYQLVVYLRKLFSMDITVIALGEAKGFCVKHNFETSGIRTKILYGRNKVKLLKDIIKKEKPDIMHSTCTIPDILVGSIKPDTIPIITTVRAEIKKELIYVHGKLRGNIESFVAKQFLKKFDLISSNSKGLEKYLIKDMNIKTPIRTVENFVEIDQNDTAEYRLHERERLGFKDSDIVIIHVCVIHQADRKRFHLLRDAITNLHAKQFPVKLLQIGIDTASDFSLKYSEPFITYLGYKGPLFKYLPIGDIFCLPSRSEGFPRSLLEAAGCGLPLIGTDIPGIADFIENRKTGILIPVNDQAALEDALLLLIKNSDLLRTIGDNAREKYLAQYTPTRAAKEYYEIYRELVYTKGK